MDATLTAAMDAYKPEIARRYAQSMRNLFADIVAKHGPTLEKVYNCWTFAKVFRNTELARYLDTNREDRTKSINEDRLMEKAMQVADETVAAWIGKIEAKMGEMDEAEARYVSGTSFRIVGTRGGHKVEIDQQMIINVSRLGRLFNQWPSRIYLDGKFTSEAAYRKMFKAAKVAA